MSAEQFLEEKTEFSESMRAIIYLVLLSWGSIAYLKSHFLVYNCVIHMHTCIYICMYMHMYNHLCI